jgi:hypothetical protein
VCKLKARKNRRKKNLLEDELGGVGSSGGAESLTDGVECLGLATESVYFLGFEEHKKQ